MVFEWFKKKSGDEGAANADGDLPTKSAQSYLFGELSKLEGLAGDKALELHNKSIELLGLDSNSAESLGTMLSEMEGDQETDPLEKCDVAKLFSELCLVLKHAAEQNEDFSAEDRKLKADEYQNLFQRGETLKHELEYAEAKKIGFDGTFEEFVATMSD